jgi:hypothetical protein
MTWQIIELSALQAKEQIESGQGVQGGASEAYCFRNTDAADRGDYRLFDDR